MANDWLSSAKVYDEAINIVHLHSCFPQDMCLVSVADLVRSGQQKSSWPSPILGCEAASCLSLIHLFS